MLRRWLVLYFMTTVLFMVGAWQLDILCANLVYPVRDERFLFWFGSLSMWDAYSLFFWTLSLAYFLPVSLILVSYARGYLKKKG